MNDDAVVVLHLPDPPVNPPDEVYLIEIIDPMWPDRWILEGGIWRDEEAAVRQARLMKKVSYYSAIDARVAKFRRVS